MQKENIKISPLFTKIFNPIFFILILGLLTHMEHMRMDPKHQFAAQYVLSRAAAERRERELLAGSSLGTYRIT